MARVTVPLTLFASPPLLTLVRAAQSDPEGGYTVGLVAEQISSTAFGLVTKTRAGGESSLGWSESAIADFNLLVDDPRGAGAILAAFASLLGWPATSIPPCWAVRAGTSMPEWVMFRALSGTGTWVRFTSDTSMSNSSTTRIVAGISEETDPAEALKIAATYVAATFGPLPV